VLPNLTSGSRNTATGASALQNNTSGSNNTVSGVSALVSNTPGNGNTASDNALTDNYRREQHRQRQRGARRQYRWEQQHGQWSARTCKSPCMISTIPAEEGDLPVGLESPDSPSIVFLFVHPSAWDA